MLHSDITPQWAISKLYMDSPSQFLKISVFRITCWHTSRKLDSMYVIKKQNAELTLMSEASEAQSYLFSSLESQDFLSGFCFLPSLASGVD